MSSAGTDGGTCPCGGQSYPQGEGGPKQFRGYTRSSIMPALARQTQGNEFRLTDLDAEGVAGAFGCTPKIWTRNGCEILLRNTTISSRNLLSERDGERPNQVR